MILAVEGSGIGEVLDLTEHLDAEPPVLGKVVFRAPAILKAKTVRVPVGSYLIGEERVERDQ